MKNSKLEFYELALDHIVQLSDQYVFLSNQGDDLRAAILKEELDSFIEDADKDDDLFYVSYHQTFSSGYEAIRGYCPDIKLENPGFTR